VLGRGLGRRGGGGQVPALKAVTSCLRACTSAAISVRAEAATCVPDMVPTVPDWRLEYAVERRIWLSLRVSISGVSDIIRSFIALPLWATPPGLSAANFLSSLI
jgi:hypothetical protein